MTELAFLTLSLTGLQHKLTSISLVFYWLCNRSPGFFAAEEKRQAARALLFFLLPGIFNGFFAGHVVDGNADNQRLSAASHFLPAAGFRQ